MGFALDFYYKAVYNKSKVKNRHKIFKNGYIMEKSIKSWKKTPLMSSIEPISIISAFTGNYPDGYRFAGEMHDFWEIALVRSGSLWVAEEQKIQNLKKNMFIVHKPMAFHRLWCSGSDVSAKFISFEATGKMMKKLECLSGSCPWQLADRFAQTVDLASELLYRISDLEQDLASNCPCMEDERVFRSERASALPRNDSYSQKYEELTGRIKAALASILCDLSDLKGGEENIDEMSDAARILSIIDEHYLEDLTLEQLAFYCRMSESKIKKEFHKIYDGGVMKYVCRLKMRDAAAMLERGMSADKICEALSIHDKNYFSYVFRREIGMTPSEYRKTHS